jgi:hypothetical protein
MEIFFLKWQKFKNLFSKKNTWWKIPIVFKKMVPTLSKIIF